VVVFDAVEASHFPKRIGDLYLTGWHLIRKATAASSRQSGVNEWAVSMYQHPSRQRQVPEGRLNFKYTVGHDIYSLGVCMLELGLWKSLVSYDATGVASESPLLLEHERCWKEQHSAEVRTKTRAEIEQQAFLSLADQPLAYEMGEKYSQLVIMCLSCLEKGFGNKNQFLDNASKDWTTEGIQFIKRVVLELHKSSQMDI
jgi:hypothetical protein